MTDILGEAINSFCPINDQSFTLNIVPNFSSPTKNDNISYNITFSRQVKNFGVGDIVITKTGTVIYDEITFESDGDDLNFTVGITNLDGNGTITLSVVNSGSVRDVAGNLLSVSNTSTVDQTGSNANIYFNGG